MIGHVADGSEHEEVKKECERLRELVRNTLNELHILRDTQTRMQERGTQLTMETRKLKRDLDEANQKWIDAAGLLGRMVEALGDHYPLPRSAIIGDKILESVVRLRGIADASKEGWNDDHEALAECQAKLTRAIEDIGNLEMALNDTRVECSVCGASYPLDEEVTCNGCVNKASDLEQDIANMQRLLGEAVVQLNKKVPDTEWMKRFKKQHEKYLHQTPTARNMDLEEELFRMKGARNDLEDQKRKLEKELEASKRAEKSAIKMFDDFAEELIDELEPHFYDRNRPEAQVGADYEQITEAVRRLVAKCKPHDFREEIELMFGQGLSDDAIVERLDLDPCDGSAVDLVALARKTWEKEKEGRR